VNLQQLTCTDDILMFCCIWFSLVLCLPSVLLHCWLGHLTRKNPVPDMTYNVFSGTLNIAQLSQFWMNDINLLRV